MVFFKFCLKSENRHAYIRTRKAEMLYPRRNKLCEGMKNIIMQNAKKKCQWVLTPKPEVIRVKSLVKDLLEIMTMH